MTDLQKQIHEKGFNMGRLEPQADYSKIKVGMKTLDDATLNLGSIKKIEKTYGDKRTILQALANKDYNELREISKYYYATNGVYKRACDYVAYLYRYDWWVEPIVFADAEDITPTKIKKDFNKILNYLDNSHIKKMCGDIASKVIVEGAYYGVVVQGTNQLVLQELPAQYCRNRYNIGNTPAIELNMKFFDDNFKDLNYRLRVLNLFPKDIQKGYLLYKQGKLQPDYIGDTSGSWYLLEPGTAIKFNLGSSDVPVFVNSIPEILDLDSAQDLDRRKQMQKLLKILIQKLPLDKNGDLIFDIDEARDIHNNAVEMLSRAIGVDVLTTFADISVEDMADNNTTTTNDDLQRVERSVYNSLGISQNLFNTDGNIALEKSILTDESSMRSLLLQFETFLDKITQQINPNRKKYSFRLHMLETTQFNYKELSKIYKEQTQLGFAKMLPQIALGHCQSSILNTAYFENEILNLSEIMIPPMSSNTMNADGLLALNSSKKAGREEKPDDEKSEKTIQNRESMS